MTEKRFTFTQDTLAKADVFDKDKFVCCTLSVWVEQLVDLLNQLNDENEQLKQELLFFLDVANGQCSSSFQKDMEHDCQKLFNCSYDEAKRKYGSYDATWWELGE